MARPVRIVVGEGRAAQQGLLRFVLEGEGFDVVGEARGTADLTEVIESNEPDVVVLDDGIGVIAVSMVHEVAPRAKVVLVWPSAVVPIGGDARVEPARILRDLGAAVTQVMAPAAALTETFERPGWVEKVRKDPTALREKLVGKETMKRPSVTRLQRRGKRLHPTGSRSAPAQRDRDEEEVPAPVVVLPVGVGGADLEPVLDIGGGAVGTESGDAPVEERSEWNRRLGTLALSGAAAVSALVLALALGGGRVPVSVIRGGGQVPVGVPGIVQAGQGILGPYGSGTLGGGGYDPTVVDEPSGPDEGGTPFGEDPGLGGDLASPGGSGGRDEPAPIVNPGPDDGPGGGGGGNDGGGGGNGGGGGGGDGGGGNGGGNGGGGGDDGGTLGKGGKNGSKHKNPPGHSGEHNPHGGPPGHMGDTPAHGPGLGVGSSAHHSSHGHAHKH